MHNPISGWILKAARPARMRSLDSLERSQWLSSDELRARQARKLRSLLEHSSQHVPFYSDILRNVDIHAGDECLWNEFQKIPLLTKSVINQSRETLKSDATAPQDFLPNTTGGSTGSPLQFYGDRKSADFTNALTLRNTRWTGWDLGDKQAYVWGSTADISLAENIYAKLRNALIHRKLYLSSYSLEEANLREYIARINRFKPALITGYVSALCLLAEYSKYKNLPLRSPRGIIAAAETLHTDQRDLIESAFGCRVFNRYGCREVGNIAQECTEQNGLHINAEHVVLETVSEKGRPCSPGETGEIVITDLDNFAFPFIRYRMEDLGALSDRTCRCGRGLSMLEAVQGRIWDVIVGANGSRLVGSLWLFKGISGIIQFQILQEDPGELIVKLVKDDSFTDSEMQEIRARIKEKCGEEMKADIRIVEDIPLTPSGKRKFIISKVSPYVR